jgi:hypothetical protein
MTTRWSLWALHLGHAALSGPRTFCYAACFPHPRSVIVLEQAVVVVVEEEEEEEVVVVGVAFLMS